MNRKKISQDSPFEQKIGYSRAVVDGSWIFVSGTTGFNYDTMKISEEVKEQTEQCFKNIQWALDQAGSTIEDIVRVRYIFSKREDFEPCWPILKKYLGKTRPAATMIIADLLDPRMKVEIEVTARKQR